MNQLLVAAAVVMLAALACDFLARDCRLPLVLRVSWWIARHVPMSSWRRSWRARKYDAE